MTDQLQSLNRRFALAGHLQFKAGPGGLAVADINNEHAAATVVLPGAHVLSFQPRGQRPVLWASAHSRFESGQPIRGGIPLVWPWFGAHPTDPAKPAHGFARTSLWAVSETAVTSSGATRLRLSLTDSDETRSLWPHPFQLEFTVTVGVDLQVELAMRNVGQSAFTCGAALHSYFAVSDAGRISILGLEGGDYLDKVDGGRRKTQAGPVTIAAETDRIYLDTTAACVIDDPGWGRRIRVAKLGSRSTVVWNPWVDKSRRMADFGDEEYPGMVCVETANAADDVVTVAPAGEHRLQAVIGVVG